MKQQKTDIRKDAYWFGEAQGRVVVSVSEDKINEFEQFIKNTKKEQELKEMYNAIAKTNDEEAITAFFSITKDDRTEKMKAFSERWREEKRDTFDGLWGKMKREILSKQEN